MSKASIQGPLVTSKSATFSVKFSNVADCLCSQLCKKVWRFH